MASPDGIGIAKLRYFKAMHVDLAILHLIYSYSLDALAGSGGCAVPRKLGKWSVISQNMAGLYRGVAKW